MLPLDSTTSSRSPSAVMSRKVVVVLGGNGYLGQRIVNSVLRKGANVLCVSRSGKAPPHYVLPTNLPSDVQVTWHKADVFDVPAWKSEIKDATAVVSCIGAFGSNEFMMKVNGDANALAVETAAASGVDRFVYVSSIPSTLPSFVLKGYFDGKKKAEMAVQSTFKEKGFVLRPGFIYGTRTVPLPDFMGSIVGPTMSLPLGFFGRPLEAMFGLPGMDALRNLPVLGTILAQPLSVDCVAHVAALTALGELPEGTVNSDSSSENILSIPDIVRVFRAAGNTGK